MGGRKSVLSFLNIIYISRCAESLDNLMHQIIADTGFFINYYLQYRFYPRRSDSIRLQLYK